MIWSARLFRSLFVGLFTHRAFIPDVIRHSYWIDLTAFTWPETRGFSGFGVFCMTI
jgi:hypothetical protein